MRTEYETMRNRNIEVFSKKIGLEKVSFRSGWKEEGLELF